MTPSAAVIFYISGHGFGHAVRQIVIVNALLAHAGDAVRVLVRSSAPAWLFERMIHGPYRLLPGETDTGVVQFDALRLDAGATVRRAEAFYADLPARVEAEAARLRAHDVRLVVSDAPPLACAAAAAAGVRSAVCGNFTWDWIYADYVEPGCRTPRWLDTISAAYASASAGWRLPMHGGFETVRSTSDVPLVARRARQDRSPAEVRRLLGLPDARPLALATFGGYGAENLPLDRLDCLPEWHVVLTTPDSPASAGPTGVLTVTEEALYGAGLQYQDLVAAVDVVVTKPGYGIVSDCAANDTGILYTSRGRFREYEVLVAALPSLVRARYLDQRDLFDGRWRAGLDAVLESAPPPVKPRTDGGEVVAALIAGELGPT